MSENQQIITAKQEAWQAGEETMADLVKSGATDFFKREFPDLKHAFLSPLNCVVCMDEGTAHKDIGGLNKFCLAGSGILFPAISKEERLQKVSELFIKLGVENITSHGGCGAAGLAYKRDFPDKKEVTAQEIENYAIDWSKSLTEEIERKNAAAEHIHIAAEEMERPVEFHVARVVYYDNIGGFNPNKEIGLPMGFVIGRAFVPKEYALEELKVALNIAFGHHGFGELFTKEEPVVLLVMAKDENGLTDLKKEMEEAVKNNVNYTAGKIKIDGLIV